jgi:hypothetical protein
MEDLASLQKKLIEIQKSGSTFKLSERTVVDIIQKIMSRGKLKLIHTSSGKEYVAEEKITKEIQDEVKKNKGRISKLDLVKSIEVTGNIIDSRVNLLLSKDKTLNLIENKIVTNYYLENMCNEINEMLSINGCLMISDLSTRYDFSIDFMKRFIKERLGQMIKAKLYATRLLTDDYVEEQKQRLRPVLISSTTPVQLQQIMETYHIDDMIIEELVNSLIAKNVVRGKLVSNTYEPSIFNQSQSSFVTGGLLNNNYIEYAKLKTIGIKNPKEYIKDAMKNEKSLANGIFLKEYFISSNLKSNFESIYFENSNKNNAINLNNIFFFDLLEEDVNHLLESINIKPNTVIIINNNIIPMGFVENFIIQLSGKLKEEAGKQYNTYVSKLKEKEKKKAEEKDTGKGAKGGKKGGKAKGKNKYDDEDEEEGSEDYIQFTPNFKKELQAELMKSSNLEDLNETEETLTELFNNHLLPKLSTTYIQFVNGFIKSKSQPANDPKNLMNQIENEFFNLRMIQKSVEQLMKLSQETNFQSAIKAIIAHICKKDLSNLLKNVLTYQLIHMKSKIDLNKINNPNERKEVINSAIPDEEVKEVFQILNEAQVNKNFIQFMETLQKNSKILAISLSNLDKKKEKVLNEKYSGELFKQIDERFNLIGNLPKKDYLALTVDICQSALLKKGFFLSLPAEPWAIGIFSNLMSDNSIGLGELKTMLTKINELLNLTDDELFIRQDEIGECIKKLYNSF